jgi:hypothetical protein
MLGILTVWPLLYILLIGGVTFLAVIADAGRSRHVLHEALFGTLLLMHLAVLFLVMGLTAFYIVYLFTTERVPQSRKAFWGVVLLLGNVIAMPVFFGLYIWPDKWRI